MNDLKGLDEEAIFAMVIVGKILSDKFVFDVLSKTPVKDDVIACQFSTVKQLLSGWHKSKKTLDLSLN